MKLIIDIPEEDYLLIRKQVLENVTSPLKVRIANGTPLPKGYGRLIDEKEACDLIAEGKDDKAYFGTVSKDWEVIDFLKTVPTVIEAN